MTPQKPATSQRSLRRLIWIVVFAIILIIFSYGWTVTDIDLSVPQQPQRQINVGNALRELLSPNVFTQEYDVTVSTTTFTIGCPDDFTQPEVTPVDEPYIVVEPACADANELVTVKGYNFAGDQLARLNWIDNSGERRIRQVVGRDEDNFITADDGTFSVQIEVPRIRASIGQTHTIEAQGRVPAGAPEVSETTGLVLEKMLETIFLALIATTVSILPAAILSFFAAYNLMRNVRTPMGNLLVSIALLPFGFLLGAALLGALGRLTLTIGAGGETTTAALSGLIGIASVASARSLRTNETNGTAPMSHWQS
ncbi:MAG: hypothetical protein KC519_11045, partial [Anaerolineae bacterium]|nr:hypothetical protein [Anaerolineae bacterium]